MVMTNDAMDLEPHVQGADTSAEEPPGTPATELSAGAAPVFDRPPRRPLVPLWIPLAGLGGVIAISLVVALVVALAAPETVPVPDVVGKDQGDAIAALEQAGLQPDVTQSRFDPRPAGTVLEQNPGAGSQAERGSTVSLVVSAGSEQFIMPDVVGDQLAVAKARLEGLGLVVDVEYEESDLPKDTVLRTFPAPGDVVNTADTVRLTVASEASTSPGLLPYRMDGLKMLIDPAPVEAGRTDITLQIARRLQSLLEYSGVDVTVTRSSATSATPERERAEQAREASSAVVAIGLTVDETGPAGMTVTTVMTKANASSSQATRTLAQAIATLLAEDGRSVKSDTSNTDPVLGAARGAVVRIRLGSFGAEADKGLFTDPVSSDRVAEVLYRAIGERYGTPQ